MTGATRIERWITCLVGVEFGRGGDHEGVGETRPAWTSLRHRLTSAGSAHDLDTEPQTDWASTSARLRADRCGANRRATWRLDRGHGASLVGTPRGPWGTRRGAT